MAIWQEAMNESQKSRIKAVFTEVFSEGLR
jgi:hypothetical protein